MESGGASPMPSASRTSTPTATSTVHSNLSQVTSVDDVADPSLPKKTKICVYCGSSPGKNPVYMQAARDLARVMAENNIGLVYGGGTVGLMGELARSLVALAGPDSVHGIIPEALVRYERDPNYTSRTRAAAAQAKAEGGDTRQLVDSTNGEPKSEVNGASKAKAADGTDGTDGTDSLAIPAEEVFGKTTVVKDMHTRKRIMAQEVLQAGPGSGFIALSGGYGTFEELLETSTWNQLGIHNKGVCVLNINGFYDGLFAWIRTSVDEGFISEGNAGIIVEAKTAEDAILALRDYKVAPSVLKLSWDKQ
ncbi:lysine decarboxylase-like protein [Sporothrix brasiliensis 5110]|uniref:Lysine decarboxylase-like protein n=1 Tax=Sporothrix brasiliensis 5110 TaxID=1398154 RepID=A0A0C2J0Z8_9PEZI|nr:lysine decarboxylase-like protein [Sporothrix brasiliensis 5110]KIH95046.1 lysine decarboxylase-like protein [Sporothrix brasiliensis 5110]